MLSGMAIGNNPTSSVDLVVYNNASTFTVYIKITGQTFGYYDLQFYGGDGGSSSWTVNPVTTVATQTVPTGTLQTSSLFGALTTVISGVGTTNVQTLNVSGYANINQSLNVLGTTNTQFLNVTGQSNLQGLNVTGTTNTQFLNVASSANVALNLNVAGTTNLATLNVTGYANINQSLNVLGTTNLVTLNVTGTTNHQGINITGVTNITATSATMGTNIFGYMNLVSYTGSQYSTLNVTGNAYISGNLTCGSDVTAFSDAKLKSNLEIISNALKRITNVSGYTFTRNDLNDGRRYTGVIAQEINQVLPEAVYDTGGVMCVAYGNLIGLLIESVKEMERRVSNIEKNIGIQ
jgi:hypothetical protein